MILVMVLEDNSELREAIKGYALPTIKYFTIKATSDGKFIMPGGIHYLRVK